MKLIVLLLFPAFLSIQSSAYPGQGGAELLKSNTWITHFSLEPVVKDRRSIKVKFKQDGSSLNFAVTCHYSELGLGSDATVELESNIILHDNTFDVRSNLNQATTNDQGKPCSATLSAGTYPYVISWDNTQVTMFHRAFAPKK